MSTPDPFSPVSTPRAYVPRPATESALAETQAALESGAPIVALLGPPGIGKTLLLRILARRLSSRFRTVHVPYPDLAPEDILRWAVRALASEADAGAAARAPDAAHVHAERDARTLLLVDDASALPLETARRLGRLAHGSQGRLRVVLASVDDERSAAVFRALGLDVAVVRFDTGMSEAETVQYLRARLERAGLDPAQRARLERAAAPLHLRSGGVPGAVHREADSILRPRFVPIRPAAPATRQTPPPQPVPSPPESLDTGPRTAVAPARRAVRRREALAAAPRATALLTLALGFAIGFGVARAPRPPVAAPQPASEPAAATAPLAAAAPLYRVNVNARPWASIEIDGVPVGETPLGDLPLRGGAYEFVARMPDGRVLKRAVEVRSDHQRVVFADGGDDGPGSARASDAAARPGSRAAGPRPPRARAGPPPPPPASASLRSGP